MPLEEQEHARAAAGRLRYSIHISRTARHKPQRDAATARSDARMSPIRGRECGTKTRSKQTGSFDWAKGVENPPRQRHQSGVGSWPRAAASAAAAGIMIRHEILVAEPAHRNGGVSGSARRIPPTRTHLYKAYKARRYPNPSVSSRPLLCPPHQSAHVLARFSGDKS